MLINFHFSQVFHKLANGSNNAALQQVYKMVVVAGVGTSDCENAIKQPYCWIILSEKFCEEIFFNLTTPIGYYTKDVIHKSNFVAWIEFATATRKKERCIVEFKGNTKNICDMKLTDNLRLGLFQTICFVSKCTHQIFCQFVWKSDFIYYFYYCKRFQT